MNDQTRLYPSSAERFLAALCHLTALFSATLIVLGVPILILLCSNSEYVRNQAKETLNFQITLLVWVLISIPCCMILVGFVMLFVLIVCSILLPIFAALSAAGGARYRYPSMTAMRMFRPVE